MKTSILSGGDPRLGLELTVALCKAARNVRGTDILAQQRCPALQGGNRQLKSANRHNASTQDAPEIVPADVELLFIRSSADRHTDTSIANQRATGHPAAHDIAGHLLPGPMDIGDDLQRLSGDCLVHRRSVRSGRPECDYRGRSHAQHQQGYGQAPDYARHANTLPYLSPRCSAAPVRDVATRGLPKRYYLLPETNN